MIQQVWFTVEHFFGHLSLEEGIRLLRECLRILLPGGRLSLGVPNAQLCMQDYVNGDRAAWIQVRDRYHPKWCTTPMHSANYFFRQTGEQKYSYDSETLIEVMSGCGFSNVHERSWDAALDREMWQDGTLYVDGEKSLSELSLAIAVARHGSPTTRVGTRTRRNQVSTRCASAEKASLDG